MIPVLKINTGIQDNYMQRLMLLIMTTQ